jgi:hypothetical protein
MQRPRGTRDLSIRDTPRASLLSLSLQERGLAAPGRAAAASVVGIDHAAGAFRAMSPRPASQVLSGCQRTCSVS